VRLLELSGGSRAKGRLSFLVGAFIGAELDRLQARGALPRGTPVTVTGDAKLGGAWEIALDRGGCPVRSLSAEQTESGFLGGLGAILAARGR
jgi:2-keto-3-deoxy-galactonokinase